MPSVGEQRLDLFGRGPGRVELSQFNEIASDSLLGRAGRPVQGQLPLTRGLDLCFGLSHESVAGVRLDKTPPRGDARPQPHDVLFTTRVRHRVVKERLVRFVRLHGRGEALAQFVGPRAGLGGLVFLHRLRE